MKFSIITPLSKTSYDIVWLEAQTDNGNFVIQKGHAPTMLVLAPDQELQFRLNDGKQKSIVVPHGILQILRDELTAIIKEV